MISSQKITSLQNTQFKKACLVSRNNHKRQYPNLFAIEGKREVTCAVDQKFPINSVWYCPTLLDSESWKVLQKLAQICSEIYEINQEMFDKLVVRKGTDGIFCLGNRKDPIVIDTLEVHKKSCFLVLSGCEKPGNLGAIFRTAEATGVEAIILEGGSIDPFNPNVIRASLGAAFRVPTIISTREEILAFTRTKKIPTIGAIVDKKASLWCELTLTDTPCCFVLGSEASGLDELWQKSLDYKAYLPMLGKGDSLNLSVAAGIFLYERVKQNITC